MLLHDYMENFARDMPDHHWAEMDGRVVTYSEADVLANRFANSLSASGITKGVRFAYLSRNSIEMAMMYFAASKVGAVPVPLNYRLAPREWLYIINDADSKALFIQDDFAEGIDSVRDELAVDHYILTRGARDGWATYDSWLGDDDSKPDVEVLPSDLLYQMYTSGTTGLPKGAMLSQSAIDNNLVMFSNGVDMRLGKERGLVVAPMYHAAAGVSLMMSGSRGGTIVIQEDFNPVNVVDALSNERITSVTLVPAMIQACLVAVPDIADRDFSELRFIGYGASPIAQETLKAAMGVFGCGFIQGFGMTETSAIVTILSAEDHERAVTGEPGLLASCGRPAVGTQVKIVDDDDNEVPRGTVGEIIVKGPQLMSGYWNLPEATDKALKSGWMHTGDAAYMEDDGYLYIKDRIKDMIVSGGENIYPTEIENALFEHEAVEDAAVIGIPSEQWGESVMAFVVLKEGQQLSADDVIEHCRPRLGGYKIPRKVEFLAEIPRNASGKVLKKDLREPYWEGVERRVG